MDAWFSRPTLSVPSKFYAGKDFLPATGNPEFPKSDPRRDVLILWDRCSPVNQSYAFIPPLKGVGFRLILYKNTRFPRLGIAGSRLSSI